MATTANPAPLGGMHIRQAAADDIEALTRLINAAFVVERVVFEGDRVNVAKVRAYFGTGAFLLAEVSREVVGCVYIELEGERAHLGLLSVDPSRQGSGVASSIVSRRSDPWTANRAASAAPAIHDVLIKQPFFGSHSRLGGRALVA